MEPKRASLILLANPLSPVRVGELIERLRAEARESAANVRAMRSAS